MIKDVYALGHLAYQTDGSGNKLATFTYDANGVPSSVVIGSGTTTPRYSYVYNGHGDVVALTDSVGTVVASYSYDAFGNLTSSSESLPNGWSNPYRYDGAEGVRYDGETGLYWLSVRAYDPTLGRFLSHDPLGRLAAWGIDFQPYVYASNNPVVNTDPTGLVSCPIKIDGQCQSYWNNAPSNAPDIDGASGSGGCGGCASTTGGGRTVTINCAAQDYIAQLDKYHASHSLCDTYAGWEKEANQYRSDTLLGRQIRGAALAVGGLAAVFAFDIFVLVTGTLKEEVWAGIDIIETILDGLGFLTWLFPAIGPWVTGAEGLLEAGLGGFRLMKTILQEGGPFADLAAEAIKAASGAGLIIGILKGLWKAMQAFVIRDYLSMGAKVGHLMLGSGMLLLSSVGIEQNENILRWCIENSGCPPVRGQFVEVKV